MFGQLSETVIELYRRYAGQWNAARRGSVGNDRGWLQPSPENSAAVRAFSISAAAAENPSRGFWLAKDSVSPASTPHLT
jgi:hypothetical protein